MTGAVDFITPSPRAPNNARKTSQARQRASLKRFQTNLYTDAHNPPTAGDGGHENAIVGPMRAHTTQPPAQIAPHFTSIVYSRAFQHSKSNIVKITLENSIESSSQEHTGKPPPCMIELPSLGRPSFTVSQPAFSTKGRYGKLHGANEIRFPQGHSREL